MFWDYQPYIMGIRPQNVPQTSNSLLSPTKSMVARGNHFHAPPHTLHVRCTSAHPSTHLHAPLRAPLSTPPLTSMHPSAHLSTPLGPPLRTPLCTSIHPSMHLHTPLHTSVHTSVHPSAHLRTPLCTSVHLCAPLCTPLHTSVQDFDWLIVPTTSNHIPAFKNLINIKSRFFSPPPLWKTSEQPE